MAENLKSNLNKAELIARAGQLAVSYKRMGYHCSESMIRAVPEALGLNVPADMIRCACAFFGGGGGTGGRCGIMETGIMLISYLYGRMHPMQSVDHIRTLVRELTDRFEKQIGHIDCRDIKPGEVARFGAVIGCEDVYRRGAELLTELLLETDEILRKY